MSQSSQSAQTRIVSGARLRIYVLGYGVLAVLAILLFILNIPYVYSRGLVALSSERQALVAAGLPSELPAVYDLVLRFIFFWGFAGVSLLLFWKRARDPMALLVSVMLISTGYLYATNVPRDSALWIAAVLLNAVAETTQVLFLFSFPTGRFIPPWIRFIALPLFLFRFIVWMNIFVTRGSQGAVEVGMTALLDVIGLGVLIYRYRRFASPTQRQQVKSLLVGIVLTVLLVVPSIYLLSVTSAVTPSANLGLYLLVRTTRDLALLSVPLMIALAILRYRLWDIDLTINRSLVGAAVTITLIAIFGVIFLGMQWLFTRLLGDSQSGLAFGIAGLAAGLSFGPVRHRVRKFVDRRLYGFRFDLNDLHRAQKPEVKRPAALTGTIIDGYEILDLIGRGGMGEVYKAYKDGQLAAVKLLRPDVLENQPNVVARFEREAQLLKDLEHPSVVKLVSMNTSAAVPYLILDYVEGDTLSQYLKERGALPLDEFRRLAAHIAEAIHYIHQHGIVHRDIKPSNIMLKADPAQVLAPVLMDFGIARGDSFDITLTGSNAVGTIDYMAPEQIESAHDVEHFADIYALGVVFYEMLVGQRPFTGNAAHVLFAHIQQPPPNPRAARPDIPIHISNAIVRALHKKPSERFESAALLRDAILAN